MGKVAFVQHDPSCSPGEATSFYALTLAPLSSKPRALNVPILTKTQNLRFNAHIMTHVCTGLQGSGVRCHLTSYYEHQISIVMFPDP